MRFAGGTGAWRCAAVAVTLAAVLLAGRQPVAARQAARGEWMGSWYAAPTARVDPPAAQAAAAPAGTSGQSRLHFKNQTLRQIVHLTLGGSRLRIVIGNTFGTAGLKIGAASVALRDREAAIVPQSSRALTFGGAAGITVPAGAVTTSDPVDLAAPDFADLAIDLYLPGDTSAMASPITTHPASWQTGYVSPAGNHAGAVTMPVEATTRYRRGDGLECATWFFLTRVEVPVPPGTGGIVAIGDSITDGTASGLDANNRWPDHLARRLVRAGIRMPVLNAGIGGNRVLLEGNGPAALARFDRDVLSQPGVTHVVVLEGINDIGQARANPSPAAADLIAAHKALIDRAHARGLRIFGATLTPFEGANYWTPEGEAKRQQLNEWIRTGRAYDAVFDFDAVVRDPAHPAKTLARYDPGDHLHLNADGYQAVADAIDLQLFARGVQHLAVEYGRPGGHALLLDARIPDGPGPFPAAILVHGGGFDGGSRATNMSPTFQPLTDAGFAWFSIDYRMAPEFRFSEAREDVDAAIAWVKANARTYKVDPAKIVLAGESAGGFLVNYAATHETPATRVAAVVDIYGPVDYEKIARQRQAYPNRFNMASINSHQKTGGGIWFFGAEGYDEASYATLKAISPIYAVHTGMPPFLAIHGTRDDQVPYEQSTMMCEAMRRVGARCDIITVEAGGHGMGGWKDADQQHYKAEMISWLKATLGVK